MTASGASAPAHGGRPEYGAGRDALLNAAITVVAQRGLRYLTYRSVAAEAGVTHGLVAHHFGSRDALLMEALRHSVRRSIDVTSLIPDSGSPDDFVRGLADMVDSDPELHAFQYEVLLESRRSPEVREHAEELFAAYRAASRAGLARIGIGDGPMADLRLRSTRRARLPAGDHRLLGGHRGGRRCAPTSAALDARRRPPRDRLLGRLTG